MQSLLSSLSVPMILASSLSAFAGGSTLTLTTGSGSDDVLLFLGPSAGRVTVSGVDGISDGTTFLGIDEILLDTGVGSDKVTVLGSLAASMDFDFNTQSDSDQVFFQFSVPASASFVAANVRVDTGSGSDQVVHEIVNSANTFVLDAFVLGQTGSDDLVVKVDSSASTVSRLGVFVDGRMGSEADVIDVVIQSSARLAQFSFADEASFEDESVSIVWDQTPRPGRVLGSFDLNSGGVTVDLKGEGSLFRMIGQVVGGILDDDITLKTDGILVANNLVLEGGAGNDSLELLVGLDLYGAPLLSGGQGDDYLKLIIERNQLLFLGIPTIDGGPGSDDCDAPGVVANIINCE